MEVFETIIILLGMLLCLLLFIAFTIMLVALVIVLFIELKSSKKVSDEYCGLTNQNIYQVRNDRGKIGEFKVFKSLYKLSGNRKFLFNLYIPNGKNGTSEIDVLLIHETGIYVIESKNYSGWIFGSENNMRWTEVLGRKKYTFYNPIKQNETHMKHLEELIRDKEWKIDFYSIIVFGNECQLKNINISSNRHKVTRLMQLGEFVPSPVARVCLTSDEINQIYDFLYPYSQVSDEVKKRHVEEIGKNAGETR